MYHTYQFEPTCPPAVQLNIFPVQLNWLDNAFGTTKCYTIITCKRDEYFPMNILSSTVCNLVRTNFNDVNIRNPMGDNFFSSNNNALIPETLDYL